MNSHLFQEMSQTGDEKLSGAKFRVVRKLPTEEISDQLSRVRGVKSCGFRSSEGRGRRTAQKGGLQLSSRLAVLHVKEGAPKRIRIVHAQTGEETSLVAGDERLPTLCSTSCMACFSFVRMSLSHTLTTKKTKSLLHPVVVPVNRCEPGRSGDAFGQMFW